jgi:hypothetical protein
MGSKPFDLAVGVSTWRGAGTDTTIAEFPNLVRDVNGYRLLGLDTDWYESTACELKFLYPRLSDHGVLIGIGGR